MVNFVNKKFLKVCLGNKKINSHIDAVHACAPNADKFTGEIVAGIVKKIKCSGIVATVSRTVMDLNRPKNIKNYEAVDEYRQTIKEILQHNNILNENEKLLKPYLHLAVHGMSDDWSEDIEIGTLHGNSCSAEIKEWLIKKIKKQKLKFCIDKRFCGDISLAAHRSGDNNYSGYGNNFNSFHIEICKILRQRYQRKLINMFCDIIISFNKEFY